MTNLLYHNFRYFQLQKRKRKTLTVHAGHIEVGVPGGASPSPHHHQTPADGVSTVPLHGLPHVAGGTRLKQRC